VCVAEGEKAVCLSTEAALMSSLQLRAEKSAGKRTNESKINSSAILFFSLFINLFSFLLQNTNQFVATPIFAFGVLQAS
jgi:hypothetical protein